MSSAVAREAVPTDGERQSGLLVSRRTLGARPLESSRKPDASTRPIVTYRTNGNLRDNLSLTSARASGR